MWAGALRRTHRNLVAAFSTAAAPRRYASRSFVASTAALSLALAWDCTSSGVAFAAAAERSTSSSLSVAGIDFATRTYDLPGACGCTAMQMIGTGIRYKWGLVQCYAVALYVSEKEALESPRSEGEARVEGAALLLSRVVTEPFDKALHLKFVRQLSARVVADALADAFSPRLDANNAAAQAALEEFRSAVMNDSTTGEARAAMPSGTDFTIVLRGGARCIVAVDGVVAADIHDATLCWAIADTYCGAAPVTHGDFASGAARLLRAPRV